MAAFMGDYEVFSVNVTKYYSVHEWRSDIKKVMRRTGEDLVPMVFLFGDHQIKVTNSTSPSVLGHFSPMVFTPGHSSTEFSLGPFYLVEPGLLGWVNF